MEKMFSIDGNSVHSEQGFFDIAGAESFSVKKDAVGNIKGGIANRLLSYGGAIAGFFAYQNGYQTLAYILFGVAGFNFLAMIVLGGNKKFTDGMVVMKKSGKNTTLFKGTITECEAALEKLIATRGK